MKRRNRTLNAAALIHGGTKANKKPALDGMFDTLNKRCKLSDLANHISNVDNLRERVVSDAYSKSVQSFKISGKMLSAALPLIAVPGLWANESLRLCG